MCSKPFVDFESMNEIYLEMRTNVDDEDAESYYNIQQLEGFLGYSDVKHSLSSGKFIEGEDYAKLIIDENSPPEIFLTYDGFITFIHKSRKPRIKEMKKMFRLIVHKAIFGTLEQQGNVKYVASKDIPAVVVTKDSEYGHGCYILDIGSVEEVFGDGGILNKTKNFNHSPTERVYKIGKGKEIQYRIEDHKKTYFIKNVTQNIHRSYLLRDDVIDREYSLENKIFRMIDENCTGIFKERKSGLCHKEIFILTEEHICALDKKLFNLTVKDLAASTPCEIKNEINKLEIEIDGLRAILNEKTISIFLVKEMREKQKAEIEKLEVKIEKLEKKHEVDIEKLEKKHEVEIERLILVKNN